MRTAGRVLLLALVLTACGDSDATRSPRAVAEAWTEAVNARDWGEACRLSVDAGAGNCEELLQASYRDAPPQRVDDALRWVEREGEEYRVHPEVQIVR